MASALLPLGVVAAGCHHGSDESSESPDAGCSASPTLPALQEVLASRCAGSSCHSAGTSAVFPPLAEGEPSDWLGMESHAHPGQKLVVPGHPEQSFLYMKVSGTQGESGGALMPLGSAAPNDEVVTAIHDWIAAGAPGSCSGGDAGAPPVASTDPNTLDQGELFTCPAGAKPASSPARIRRIDSPEWTSAIPKALNGWQGGLGNSTAYLNPFNASATEPYSTYAGGVTIDTATLDLYFQVLPEAPSSWLRSDPWGLGGLRIRGVNDDGALDCMFGYSVEANPSDECIDTFVDRFLTRGVLFRAPTSAEHAHLRDFLKTALAAEGGDVSKRAETLELVGQAAWLTAGALFRNELGSPAAGDPAHRNRLSNEELALAIGSMLSFHRPGAPMLGLPFQDYVGPPDPDDFCHPWLHLVSEAAADGSIQDPATIKKLIVAYGGGVDPGGQPLACVSGETTVRRRDLSIELDSRRLGPRGEYWLAPRIAGFFREWLGYGNAQAVFKDTPGATSRYATTSNPYDPTTVSFDNLQSGYYGYESTLVPQMDDTIARTVIDAANNHEDVFHALMTTRRWHLASDRVDTNGVACTQSADCTDPDFDSCATPPGLCVDSISKATLYTGRPYNVEGVPDTDEGRWVDLPADERSGVLTHPAWLSAHGNNFQDDPSLVHRGKWVREKLFCETVPGLELVMVQAKLGARGPTLSARDRVDAATVTNPTCLGCHRLMNPLGYPFEMYDHAGYLRTWDKLEADGQTPHPPDASSTIDDAPDPELDGAVQNAVAFAQRVANSKYARRCFIRQAFRYFMGRDETMADQCTLAAMEAALDKGSFFDMLAVLASSDSVVYRTPVGGQP